MTRAAAAFLGASACTFAYWRHGEGWWSKIKDRHWNGCGTERLLRTCKSGHGGGDVSYNAQASLECWGFLGWGRQQVGELLRGQLAVLSRRE